MKTVFSWIRFAFTAPWSLLCWLVVSFLCVIGFAEIKKLRFEGTGILTTEWRSWFAKHYPFSTTLGRAIVFYPGIRNDRIEKHEHIHVNQVEDLMLLSFLVGMVTTAVTGNVLLGFLIWVSGGMWQLPNFVTAMLRHGHLLAWSKDGPFVSRLKKFLFDLFMKGAYRTCEHERSAYAQTDLRLDGTSWADHQEQG